MLEREQWFGYIVLKKKRLGIILKLIRMATIKNKAKQTNKK